jgi:hypothetical protein
VNLGQQMIITTEDRLRLCLEELSESTRHHQEWHAPAGILITEVAACVASSFHDAIGISAQHWEAVFRTLIVITVVFVKENVASGRYRSASEVSAMHYGY